MHYLLKLFEEQKAMTPMVVLALCAALVAVLGVRAYAKTWSTGYRTQYPLAAVVLAVGTLLLGLFASAYEIWKVERMIEGNGEDPPLPPEFADVFRELVYSSARYPVILAGTASAFALLVGSALLLAQRSDSRSFARTEDVGTERPRAMERKESIRGLNMGGLFLAVGFCVLNSGLLYWVDQSSYVDSTISYAAPELRDTYRQQRGHVTDLPWMGSIGLGAPPILLGAFLFTRALRRRKA